MRQMINRGRVSCEPNSLGAGCPMQAGAAMGGFISYAERIDAQKVRARSQSFFDHFSQATLFYNSQSDAEKRHLVNALRFELGKLETPAIRERMVGVLAYVDKDLASQVAVALGISVPSKLDAPLNKHVPADGDVKDFQAKRTTKTIGNSPALSMADTVLNTIRTRRIAVLAADGFDDVSFAAMKKALEAAGAQVKVVAPRLGKLRESGGAQIPIDFSFLTTGSVLFDGVYVPGGDPSVARLKHERAAVEFVNEAYNHCKAIAATSEGVDLLVAANVAPTEPATEKTNGAALVARGGIVTSRAHHLTKAANEFIGALARHRHWSRKTQPPAPVPDHRQRSHCRVKFEAYEKLKDNRLRALGGMWGAHSLMIMICLALISCNEATRINTFPQGARVWVNGRDLGEAPVKFSVKSWSVRQRAYHYRAEKPGYLTKDGYIEPHLSIGRIIGASTSSCMTCAFHGFYEFDEDTEIVLQQNPLAATPTCPPAISPAY